MIALLFMVAVRAGEPTAVTSDPTVRLAVNASAVLGDRPAGHEPTGAFRQLLFTLDGEMTGLPGWTAFGTPWGYAFWYRIGYVMPESNGGRSPEIPILYEWGFSVPARLYTFNWRTAGAITAEIGLENTFGGAHWWVAAPRLSVVTGLRVATWNGGAGHTEVQYRWLPAVLPAERLEDPIRQSEHRLSVAHGFGGFLVGLDAKLYLLGVTGPERYRETAAGVGLSIGGIGAL